MTNNQKLRELMDAHKLTYRDVQRLLSSEHGKVSFSTVNGWLCAPGSVKHRNMPGPMLELLEIKLHQSA